jgi:hypothetical protein
LRCEGKGNNPSYQEQPAVDLAKIGQNRLGIFEKKFEFEQTLQRILIARTAGDVFISSVSFIIIIASVFATSNNVALLTHARSAARRTHLL